MISNLYNKGLEKLLNHDIHFVDDTVKVLLVSPDYNFDEGHEFVSDLTDEVSNANGTGYERKTLANKNMVLDSANNRIYFDADDLIYSSIDTSEILSRAIVFKQVTDDTDSPVIAMIDFPDISTNGSDVTLQVNTEGLFEVQNNIQ